ncbi:MAG: hypothetical protein AAGJ96_01170 [Pseudomonadota bacterium]
MDTLFFRTRDNGAMVFRIDTENRQRRLEMQQIATVNLRSGEIKPHNAHTVIAAAERNEIEKWIVGRRRELNARDMQDVDRLIDQLNWAAQWVQSRATKDQIEEQADPLMMAMHDLRSQIVRKRAGHLD